MSRVIFWTVVIFAVLFAIRLYNARKSRARRTEDAVRASVDAGAPMVRCARCGTFLPRGEAVTLPEAEGPGFACADRQCVKH